MISIWDVTGVPYEVAPRQEENEIMLDFADQELQRLRSLGKVVWLVYYNK